MMSSNECPYCALAEKKGELYCSRHSANMDGLKSGVFVIRAAEIPECDYHITRLAININFTGPQQYSAGGREYTIKPGRMLIINERQLFRTRLHSTQTNLSATFAFQVGLASRLKREINGGCFVHPEELQNEDQVEFIEKTYDVSMSMNSQMQSIISRAPHLESWELDESMESLLIELLELNKQTESEILSIDKVKVSTRKEVYRRLHWANEFIHDNFHKPITIDDVASYACLSPFHFKHLFKVYFRVSPHQLIIQLRLNNAIALLKEDVMIKDICTAIGWQDSSSFIRSFKKAFNTTPEAYRRMYHK